MASWDDRYKEIFAVSGYQSPNEEILKRIHPEDLETVWAKVEAALDPVNPQVAARLLGSLSHWRRYDAQRQALMKAELERILKESRLSRDVYEIAAKSLG